MRCKACLSIPQIHSKIIQPRRHHQISSSASFTRAIQNKSCFCLFVCPFFILFLFVGGGGGTGVLGGENTGGVDLWVRSHCPGSA